MFFHNPNCGILEKAQWGADEDFIMEKIGIVFGCFIPLHKGHESLIERALAENDRMIIAVCGYQQDRGKDFLPFTMRYKLVKEIFRDNPRVIVGLIDDKKIGLDGTFTHENWVAWGKELFYSAGIEPDSAEFTWYTGEPPYVEKLQPIYPDHKFVLVDRTVIKASGTQIRNNPQVHLGDINFVFEQYLRKTGKLEEDPMNPIIDSLLETDLYKFSMGQAIYHNFPDYTTTWSFKCRNKDVHFTKEMVDEIKRQIYLYCDLNFTEDELNYLAGIKWIKKSYVDFLRLWHPRYEDFTISADAECGLAIETNGTWLNTSMYEIPTLAIVNEVYFRMAYDYDELMESFEKKLDAKIALLADGTYNIGAFSEFGLRRRLSAEAQELAVLKLKEANLGKSIFVGTSNVLLAKKLGVNPVGTMAHEWIMCVGQGNHKHNPAYSNWYALDYWVKEYGILNGTALTDAITTDCFLRDFQLTYSTLFSGVRHDSGDPIEWGEKMIEHYKSLGIDPTTKTLLFSDSLDFERASKIHAHFDGKAKVAFGIGTYIANDTKVPALNIVMKTTACNGQDVAKISDVEGKGMCKNPAYVDYLQRCINWRMEHEVT
ncbi:MAG: nicotinate phosphoribosyltransferase [Butyrivibrio sp.]|nr:nicotinate phosphoribosyltransferase [Butyrivibrio sp.]